LRPLYLSPPTHNNFTKQHIALEVPFKLIICSVSQTSSGAAKEQKAIQRHCRYVSPAVCSPDFLCTVQAVTGRVSHLEVEFSQQHELQMWKSLQDSLVRHTLQ